MNDIENSIIEDVTSEVQTEATPNDNQEDQFLEKKADDELSLLKAELDALRMELKARDEAEQTNSRMLKELTEFSEYFPEVDIHKIPSEVWEQVKNGASLSASFALNLRKIEIERKKTNDFNEKNRRMSAGSLTEGDGERYFSPSEVKRMTPAQVKSHYDEIVESMRHWN